MTDKPGQSRPATDDRGIIHVEPVAVQLDEVGEDGAEIIQGVWTAGMARHHDALQRREAAIDVCAKSNELALESLQLTVDVDLPLGADALQILDLALQLLQRLLEIQGVGRRHRRHPALT